MRNPAAKLVLVVAAAVICPDSWAVDFNRDVRPIFVQHCIACHGGVEQSAGLSLVTREQAFAVTESGDASIVPGDADASYLMERVADPDDDFRMPPAEHGRRLSEEEVETIRAWIDKGAPWSDPWSFMAPERQGTLPADPIDTLIEQRALAAGLEPRQAADDAVWLRRVSFDLVGLPPTAAHRSLAADGLTEAERRQVVAELLASSHFGERMAAVWLDLARYADTLGFERDPHRDIWPYRDWVIRAFNDDIPYDEFLTKQLAGDLVDDPSMDDLVATAFHRNSPTNVEGGTDDEEFRIAAVVDRVDTTGQALLGLTMGCARCHDHPYDPITQADYYRFFDFFNSTRDADLREEWPVLRTPLDRRQYAEALELDRQIAANRDAQHARVAPIARDLAQWLGVTFTQAESTGETELTLRETDAAENEQLGLPNRGGNEVATGETVTDRSVFTTQARPPAMTATALRLDAVPTNPETAALLPQMGFVLGRLRMVVERQAPDGTLSETPVLFLAGFADEPDPFLSADDSLEDNVDGWGVYTRQRQPRSAVFVFDQPLELGEGDTLRLELKHSKATDGQGALVIRRLRASLSSDPRWLQLIGDESFAELRTELQELVDKRNAIPSCTTPVMAERDAPLKRPTHVLERGVWLSPGEPVSAGVPKALSLGNEAMSDRRDLADWLTSPRNPLTARVFVNRLWAQLFGRGLVDTVDEFGSTGVAPTHPEVLDHLAVSFAEGWGWSVKRLLRELVLTRAYGRDATASEAALKIDPDNRLLARGPRSRLTAEMVRDQALVLSGRFNPQQFGPPVMPYQPAGIWKSVYNAHTWENASDESRFRRAIYVYWKRTAGYPSLMAFDMPTREQCAAKRERTNTPLQALVTMNDPAYVELAEGFADRMTAQAESVAEQIAWGYEEATGDPPTEAAIAVLVDLHRAALDAASGEQTSEPAADADASREAFAMTVVAGALMNLDATLTK